MKASTETAAPKLHKPLRLWPGVSIVILQWIVRFVIPYIKPDAIALGVFGGTLLAVALVIWWIFFSKATLFDRWFAPVLVAASLLIAAQFLDKSIATAMMGLMFTLYSIPIMCLAFAIWAVVSRNLSLKMKRISMIATILIASGGWILIRTNGMDGESHQDFGWRWTKSSEERLIAKGSDLFTEVPVDSVLLSKEAEWPGFRGRNRDGLVEGVKIATDWRKSPPVELWRRPVGPGCSSFAVYGPLIYTQEQRGQYEAVVCYNLNTGEPVWMHRDSVRFWDAHAGAGPRSTPAISGGKVYTLGATGILNVLDAFHGRVIWSRNAASDTHVTIPGWGYTSSPLVVDSLVIVAIAGELVAYDIATGNKHWSGVDGGESYSSPQLMTIDSIPQILFANKAGIASYSIADGQVLWQIPLTGVPIVQSALISQNEVLVDEVGEGGGKYLLRLKIKNGSDGWTIQEQWKSSQLRPFFNDFVVHRGLAFGFDGPYLACIEVEKGNRKWKGDRYGGQLLLLTDQKLLLILSEKGDIALVEALPDKFTELARFSALKGKTWNHPVLVNSVLVVRNTEEMVAFRLPKKDV